MAPDVHDAESLDAAVGIRRGSESLHQTIGPCSMLRAESTCVRKERPEHEIMTAMIRRHGRVLTCGALEGGMGIPDRPTGHIVQKKNPQVTGQGTGCASHPSCKKGTKESILRLHVHGLRKAKSQMTHTPSICAISRGREWITPGTGILDGNICWEWSEEAPGSHNIRRRAQSE